MFRVFKWATPILLFFGVVFLLIFFLQGKDVAVLNPKGWIAWKQRELIITATALMLIVVLPVLFLIFFFAWKYRASNRKAKYSPDWDHHPLAELIWWGLPFVIISVLSIIVWKGCHELDPFKPIASPANTLRIQVVALDWKWLFIYPEHKIATVNFVQFPEKTPIYFEITADAPMNSFWLPQLSGQIFAMSGMKTKLNMIADETGEFRGCSANLSGTGFAGMVFTAKASTFEEFQSWVKSVRKSGRPLNLKEYDKLAQPSQYDSVTYYALSEDDLFEGIVMKYMMPRT